MSEKGYTVWLTGPPRAGKTTLGLALMEIFAQTGMPAHHLDGDEVRQELCKGLGFSRDDRDTAVMRVAYVAQLLNSFGVYCVVSQIAPYAEARRMVRGRIADYVEVYLECSLEQRINRDHKGMYAKALAGEIKNFTGVSDPYEIPADPEVICRTDKESPGESLAIILQYLVSSDRLAGPGSRKRPDPYTPEEEAAIRKRLEELGYL